MNLAPHFTLEELQGEAATPDIVENLRRTAVGLEAFRAILGVPMQVTSGWRSVAHNKDVGGSPTSDHVHGLAADVLLDGCSMYDAHTKILLADCPPFDQIEWCPFDGHIHFGFGERMRGQHLVKLKDGSFSNVTFDLLKQFPGAPTE